MFWETEEKVEFDYDTERQRFIDSMDELNAMSVEESTLYKKWIELNSDLESTYSQKPLWATYYDMIWKPTDLTNVEQTLKEIEALDPYVEIADTPEDAKKWNDIRRLIHTMELVANPGRNVKAYVKDRRTKKILGQICLGSDVTAMRVRDDYIGWSKEDKFENGKLNHTAIATTIVATQPFGYNFLGGKLVAAMTTSNVLRDYWEEKYGQKLIAVGTTSLYGVHSMYNGIPHFKTLGETAGRIFIKPVDDVYEVWHHWLKENKTEEYKRKTQSKPGVQGPASGIKQRILEMIFKELDIKASQYFHGFQRGVYLAMLYENGAEFLRGEIDEDQLKMKQKFEEGDTYTMKWWRKKATKRYKSLVEQNRLKDGTLFYLDAIGMSWEEMKNEYLKEVGR